MPFFNSLFSTKTKNLRKLHTAVLAQDIKRADKYINKPHHNLDDYGAMLLASVLNFDLPMTKLLVEHGGDIAVANFTLMKIAYHQGDYEMLNYLSSVKDSIEKKNQDPEASASNDTGNPSP